MKLDRPTIIGFKYVGIGIFAYVIALLVISAVFKYDNACAISASVAVMSAMVISAAREGYIIGKRSPFSASESKP